MADPMVILINSNVKHFTGKNRFLRKKYGIFDFLTARHRGAIAIFYESTFSISTKNFQLQEPPGTFFISILKSKIRHFCVGNFFRDGFFSYFFIFAKIKKIILTKWCQILAQVFLAQIEAYVKFSIKFAYYSGQATYFCHFAICFCHFSTGRFFDFFPKIPEIELLGPFTSYIVKNF